MVEDGGEYSCTAENRAGKVTHAARLNVYGLPYIRFIPKVTAVAGETLRLKCPVAGYPIEEIKWERTGRELPDNIRQKVMPDGTLVVSSVQKEVDTGTYTCWARNKQGHSARRSGDVTVIGKAVNFSSITDIQEDSIDGVDLDESAETGTILDAVPINKRRDRLIIIYRNSPTDFGDRRRMKKFDRK